MPDFDVNWLAVGIAVVAMQLLGFLWYGPLFGNLWMASIGKTKEQMSGASAAIAVGVVSNVVAVIALAWLIGAAEAQDLATGVGYGLLVALGFVLTTSAVQGAYESRNRTAALLYHGYNLLAYVVAGAVLGALR